MEFIMTKNIFLQEIQTNTNSEILYLSVEHMINKIYDDTQSFEEEEIKEFFANYKNYHRYLNDFAGVIYNRHGSHINQIYIDMCSYLEVDVDNKYTLEHTIIKLEKQTPELLLTLTDEEIQHQTVEHFDEKLEAIESSSHYLNNKQEFENRVEKLYKNIALVKNALNYK
jgi:predicted AlkP superfamily pyrophosphatase or phosphodiesterase